MDVYRLAADSDPSIRAAFANQLALREAMPQAKAQLLPDANLRGDYGYQDFEEQSGFNDRALEIRVVQPIFRRDRLDQLQQSEFTVKQADSDYRSAEQDLLIRVSQAYFDVLTRAVEVEFAVADKDAVGRQLEQAQRRFEVGLVTITDVHEAKARFDLATSDEIVARNDLSAARETLRELTGVYLQNLDDLVADTPLAPEELADPDAWVNLALENNPDYLAAGFQVERAREEIDRQKAGHLPTLDAVGAYVDVQSSRSNTRVLDGTGYRLSLELNLNLYQGGGIESRVREASYRYDEAKEQRESIRREVERETRNAFRTLLAAIRVVGAQAQAKVSTESSLEATQAGFDVGTRTIVDVLNAQRDALGAIRDYERARYAYVLNRLQLRRAAGVVTVGDLEEVNGFLRPRKIKAPSWARPE